MVTCFILFFASAALISRSNAVLDVPQAANLLGFWPFDKTDGLNDTAFGHTPTGVGSPKLMTSINGPFGVPETSYSSTLYNVIAGYQGFGGLPVNGTLSVYFYLSGIRSAGILTFCHGLPAGCGGFGKLSVQYFMQQSSFQIWGESAMIARLDNMVELNAWNFLCFTYSTITKEILFYNSTGILMASGSINFTADSAIPLVVGNAISAGGGNQLYMTDAVACVMLYDTILKPSEITELPLACSSKGTRNITTPSTASVTTIENSVTIPTPQGTPWPKPNALLGFWPLSSMYNNQDVSPNSAHASASNLEHKIGPFGDQYTAAGPAITKTALLSVEDSQLAVAESFTVLFYFAKSRNSQTGGLFEFIDSFGTNKAFQLRYVSNTVEASATGVTVGTYNMVQEKGAWTFAAFSFNSESGLLTVYGRHGVVNPATLQAYILATNSFNNRGVRIGYSTRWDQGLNVDDAMACVMVYSEALTSTEILQAHDACRIVLGSAPCGSPKLPLPPIPSSSSGMTTVPQAGQFPWIASLRMLGQHICSATILDQFRLITLASCFRELQAADAYQIYIGEHDLSVNESFNRQHNVRRLYLQTSSESTIKGGELAVVEVEEPIDLTNPYANDACWLEQGSHDFNLYDKQFVYGWGKNGRTSFTSSSLPRYVSGIILTDSQCVQGWGAENFTGDGVSYCFMSSTSDKNVPCSGDEGTPLLVQANADPSSGISERLVQVGLYFKRDDNCSLTKPGVFVGLNKQQFNWILGKVACTVPGQYYPEKCPQN